MQLVQLVPSLVGPLLLEPLELLAVLQQAALEQAALVVRQVLLEVVLLLQVLPEVVLLQQAQLQVASLRHTALAWPARISPAQVQLDTAKQPAVELAAIPEVPAAKQQEPLVATEELAAKRLQVQAASTEVPAAPDSVWPGSHETKLLRCNRRPVA